MYGESRILLRRTSVCVEVDNTLKSTFADIKEFIFSHLEQGDNNLASICKNSCSKPTQLSILSNKLSFSLFGAGGHCKELIHQLIHAGSEIDGIFDDSLSVHGQTLEGFVVQGRTSNLKTDTNWLLSIGQNEARKEISCLIPESNEGHPFIHPSVGYVPDSCTIGAGTQILENARIGPNVTIGKHCIIGFGASIAHDCVI